MMNPPENLKAIVQTYRPMEELIPAHWGEGDIHANTIRQHYYRTGSEKPPLLLLHGFNEYGLTWLRVAKELEDDYDIIMLDARGHGHSEGISSGFSTSLLVEDVAEAIQTLKLDRPRIIGLSQGGTTVLHLAATYPQLVHSFIFEGWGEEHQPASFANSDANSDIFEGWDEENQSASFANSEGYQSWYNAWLAWLEQLRTLNHQERMLFALPQLLPTMGGAIWPEVEYVPMVEAYALFDLELARSGMQLWSSREKAKPDELLQRVPCPALIMKHAWAFPAPGTQPTVREEPSRQPNIKIVYFENTGHLIRRVAFEQYMNRVREFLKAH